MYHTSIAGGKEGAIVVSCASSEFMNALTEADIRLNTLRENYISRGYAVEKNQTIQTTPRKHVEAVICKMFKIPLSALSADLTSGKDNLLQCLPYLVNLGLFSDLLRLFSTVGNTMSFYDYLEKYKESVPEISVFIKEISNLSALRVDFAVEKSGLDPAVYVFAVALLEASKKNKKVLCDLHDLSIQLCPLITKVLLR